VDFFLTKACTAGLIGEDVVQSLNALMEQYWCSKEIDISIHGIEIHNLLEQFTDDGDKNSVDFSMLISTQGIHEEHEKDHCMHTVWLSDALNKKFQSHGVWIEYDEKVWNLLETTKGQECVPLFYMPVQGNKNVQSLTEEYIHALLEIGKRFYFKNAGKKCQAPTTKQILRWLQSLPIGWEVQQIGFSFRQVKMEPRV